MSAKSEAGMLLGLAEQYLLGPDRLTASRFRKLLGQASYWIGFRRNQSDNLLRQKEEASLAKLLSSVSGPLSMDLFEVLVPQSSYMDIDEGAGARKTLYQRLLRLVTTNAASEAITFLTRDGAVQSLTEVNRFPGVKRCLFEADSAVWKTDLRDNLLRLIRRGQDDFVIYRSVRDLFQLLAQGLERGIEFVSREDVATILADKEFVGCMWETVVSRGIQYRMLSAYMRSRDSLIQNGIPESVMPLTPEMQSRLKEEARLQNPQTNSGPEEPNQ
jgi:hypothetical protein